MDPHPHGSTPEIDGKLYYASFVYFFWQRFAGPVSNAHLLISTTLCGRYCTHDPHRLCDRYCEKIFFKTLLE